MWQREFGEADVGRAQRGTEGGSRRRRGARFRGYSLQHPYKYSNSPHWQPQLVVPVKMRFDGPTKSLAIDEFNVLAGPWILPSWAYVVLWMTGPANKRRHRTSHTAMTLAAAAGQCTGALDRGSSPASPAQGRSRIWYYIPENWVSHIHLQVIPTSPHHGGLLLGEKTD
jgi:hypothetical protein